TLNTYADLLSSFGIRPKNITAGSCAPAVCMAHLADPPEQYLLIDIGERKTTVVGITSGNICTVRTFPSGSDGVATAGSICMGIHQSLAVVDDIPGLDYQPRIAFTTGTGIIDEGLEEEIAQHLGYPVERMDLRTHGELVFQQYPPAPWEPRQMDGALGLALVESEAIPCLNFRRGPFAENTFLVEHRKSLIKTGVLAALALISAMAFLVTDAHYTNRNIKELDRQIMAAFTSTFPKVTVIVDPLHQMRVKLQEVKKRALISTEPGSSVRSIDALNAISQRIPGDIDVAFTRLVIGDDNIQVTGDTNSLSAVDNMKSQLAKAELFKNVTITSANREKSSNRVRFKLKLQL
ncbi:MAG: GspL/Epsl periplasmic domain-containing protein, partial [Desulfobacterales bacterium]